MNRSSLVQRQQKQQLDQQLRLNLSIPEEEPETLGATGGGSEVEDQIQPGNGFGVNQPPQQVEVSEANTEQSPAVHRRHRERKSFDSMRMLRTLGPGGGGVLPGIMSGVPRESLAGTSTSWQRPAGLGGDFGLSPQGAANLFGGSITAGRPAFGRRSFDEGSSAAYSPFLSNEVGGGGGITSGQPVRWGLSYPRDSGSSTAPVTDFAMGGAGGMSSLQSCLLNSRGLCSSDSNTSSNTSLGSSGCGSTNAAWVRRRNSVGGITSGIPVCLPCDIELPHIVSGLPVGTSKVAGITSGIPMSHIKRTSSHGITSGIPPPSAAGGNGGLSPSASPLTADIISASPCEGGHLPSNLYSSPLYLNIPLAEDSPRRSGITSGIPFRKMSHESAMQIPFQRPFGSNGVADECSVAQTTDQMPQLFDGSQRLKTCLSHSLCAMEISETDHTSQTSGSVGFCDDSMEDLSLPASTSSSIGFGLGSLVSGVAPSRRISSPSVLSYSSNSSEFASTLGASGLFSSSNEINKCSGDAPAVGSPRDDAHSFPGAVPSSSLTSPQHTTNFNSTTLTNNNVTDASSKVQLIITPSSSSSSNNTRTDNNNTRQQTLQFFQSSQLPESWQKSQDSFNSSFQQHLHLHHHQQQQQPQSQQAMVAKATGSSNPYPQHRPVKHRQRRTGLATVLETNWPSESVLGRGGKSPSPGPYDRPLRDSVSNDSLVGLGATSPGGGERGREASSGN